MKEICVKPPFIKLEQFLKFCGAAESGGAAKVFIQDGKVSVNGEICLMRGKKLFSGDIVEIKNERFNIIFE